MTYYDVLDACATDICPICHLSQRAVHRYLDSVLYEFVNDPGVRARLRASLGYCNEHAWQLVGLPGGNALAIALIHRDLIGLGMTRLEKLVFRPRRGLWHRVLAKVHPLGDCDVRRRSRLEGLAGKQRCPACEHREEVEGIALAATLEALAAGDARMRAALEQSAGLCLPHLQRALVLADEPQVFDYLRRTSAAKLTALRSELDTFVHNSDYRFREVTAGPEADSWRRALAWISGGRRTR